MGCMGNNGNNSGLMGCLGAELKKRIGFCDLEEEKVQKKKKRGVSVNSDLVSMLASFDPHSLPFLLIKFLSNSFLSEVLLILCAWDCVHQQLGSDCRSESLCVRGATHWSKCRPANV